MDPRNTVYLDVLFLINFLMDYVLLWATSKFSQIKTSRLKIALGAFVGAFYSLALLLPSLHFLLEVVVKIGFSMIMIFLSFPRLNLRRFLQALGYFYLVAFTMGGAMLGTIYFLNREADVYQIINGIFIFITNIRYTWLLVAVAAAVFLVRYGVGFVKKNFFHSFFSVPVLVRFNDKEVSSRALVDTGNQLKDPLTQKPVMIVEFDLLKKLLPEEVARAFSESEGADIGCIIDSIDNSYWASRVRMIPFSSIGKYRGMLIGLRPDEVIVKTSEGSIKIKDIIIGIYHKKLSPEGSYRALLHPDIFHSTMGL